jgi:hypothetical protein
MGKQHGISLSGLIMTLAVLAAAAILAAKLLPVYVEYFAVKKMFAAMEQNGDTKGTIPEIRRSYDTRNAIEDVKNVTSKDLEITNEGGDKIVSATWSVKVPLVANISLLIDFDASTAPKQ